MIASAIATLMPVAPSRAASPAPTSDTDSAVIRRGEGPEVVLIAGLLGGTVRLAPLADSLAREGFHVLAIDPYQLGVSARDVSFHGLALEVEAVLAREHIESAVVVAHGHATSIALCLAALAPARVRQLVLLDGGILASPRSPGISQAVHVASFVAHLPFGHALIRSRMVAGIRENSGDTRWLTDAAAHQYVDPVLAHLPEVGRLTRRLAASREPEQPVAVLGRVRAEVTVLVGAAPHESEPAPEELAPLASMPGVHIRRLSGVGHFVYEEAPTVVVREVQSAYARSVASVR